RPAGGCAVQYPSWRPSLRSSVTPGTLRPTRACRGRWSGRPWSLQPRGGIVMSEAVGAIAALWRFPVKSMPGERLDTAEVTERGVVGDRSYALIEAETGKGVEGENPKVGPANSRRGGR